MLIKEIEIQETLNLMKVFKGYVQILDVVDTEDTKDCSTWIIYEIKALTRKSAKHRLKKICKNLTISTGLYHNIKFFFNPEDDIYLDVNIIERRTVSV